MMGFAGLTRRRSILLPYRHHFLAAFSHTTSAQYYAFDRICGQFIDGCGSATLFKNRKTGAELMSVSNTDEHKCFGIAFRTPLTDSTGVAHILQNAVLCGSRKYGLKQPLLELSKSSLHSFVDFYTYPDRTCFLIASPHTKVLYNFLDVLLDGIFFPACVEDPLLFNQEGWHYTFDETRDCLKVGGLAFSKMKGVYSHPDSLLGTISQKALFPQHPYGFDSGGDPKVIPKLSFEEFKEFHHKYYHPSNAKIWFYGDDDPNERLRILSEYLDLFDARSAPNELIVQPQKLFSRPVTIIEKYPPEEGDDMMKKHMVCLNWLLSEEPLDLETELGVALLDHLLIGTPTSSLRRILLECGLGEALIGAGIEDELLQPMFSIGLKGVQEDNIERVEELIMKSFTQLAEDGFDSDAVEASLNTIEFSLRENNTDSFPHGLALMLRAIGKWIHGMDPFEPLKYERPLRNLRARIAAEGSKAVLSTLIEKFILRNPHRVTVRMQPDREKASRDEEGEKEILNNIKASMTREDLAELARATQELQLKQETPDPPDALKSLPSLSIEDIAVKYSRVPTEIGYIDGVKILQHDLCTNDILYADIVFDMKFLKQELLPLVPLFCLSLKGMGTNHLDFVQLNHLIGRKTGGISVYPFTSSMQGENPCSYLVVRGKAMSSRVEDLFNLMNRLLHDVQLTNKMRFKQFVSESKARMENQLRATGHAIAASRMDAKLDSAGWMAEQMGGVSYLDYLRGIEAKVDNEWLEITSSLEQMRRFLCTRDRCVVNLTGDRNSIAGAEQHISKFLKLLPLTSQVESWTLGERLPSTNEAILIPTQVNYVGKAANLYEAGYRFKGSVCVISKYISNTWLWDRVQVRGGAYGGYCDIDTHTGVFKFLSYRDPNLLETLDVYDGTNEFLRRLEMDDDSLTKAIIGTIGDVDSYQLPDAKGYYSLLQDLLGITEEERQRRREEILSTRLSDFKDFADIIEAVKDKWVVVAVASPHSVEAAHKKHPAFFEVKKAL